MRKKTNLSPNKKSSKESKRINIPYSKLSIISFVLMIISFLSPLIGIIAIIIGIFALKDIRRYKLNGAFLATLGIILSSVWLLLLITGLLSVIRLPGVKVESPAQAVKEMSPLEKAYFDNALGRLNSNSTVTTVNELFGKPYKIDHYFFITTNYYHCPNTLNSHCVIEISYVNSKIFEVKWIEPLRFTYRQRYK